MKHAFVQNYFASKAALIKRKHLHFATIFNIAHTLLVHCFNYSQETFNIIYQFIDILSRASSTGIGTGNPGSELSTGTGKWKWQEPGNLVLKNVQNY